MGTATLLAAGPLGGIPWLNFLLQFALVLAAILIGVRKGGVALGLIGGMGVALLVLVFRDQPGKPPIEVMLIILAVVTASATLHVTGGIDYMVQLTEKLLRGHPKYVTFLAPLCTFFLTVAVGTGHAVYALLPVIADVSLKAKIRPERPLAVSTVASQMGITASPVAAAAATFLSVAQKSGQPTDVLKIVMITIPAGIIGVLIAAAVSFNRGKELYKDPEFLNRMEDPEFKEQLDADFTTLDKVIPTKGKVSVGLFFLGVAAIILISLVPSILPSVMEGGKVVISKTTGLPKVPPMTEVVQFIMLAAGCGILFYAGVKSKEIVKSSIFISGMTAVVTIFGIAWMSETFIGANEAFINRQLGGLVQAAPWMFAVALFAASALVKSQAAVLTIMLPLGYKFGLPTHVLVGMLPAAYAYFFFPFYPSDLAAIAMDRSGTTRIGKYLLNHSFMRPGLCGVISSTLVAMTLAKLFL